MEALGLMLGEADNETLSDIDGERLALGLTLAEILGLGEGLILGLALAENEGSSSTFQ